mmetsp:Transcript_11194/g.30909  ORF Transcript_11194/g.30909 Transcript_11194/m.30909 type:complete len:427 (+) Transcript_11194:63-1343(+)
MTTARSISWISSVQKRLGQHLQNQTTDLLSPALHTTRANAVYLDPRRDQVARAAPSLVLPSTLLPPGHVVADHLPTTNMPVLLYRDSSSNNTVKAYRNQCRHRGAALIKPTKGLKQLKGSAVTCPYHAWTYNLGNGELKAVPQEKVGFPCLKKQDLGLKPLACREVAGGIWVGGQELSETGDQNVWSLDEVDSELKALWETQQQSPSVSFNLNRMVGFREWVLNANWQIIVETFLETYHVQFLHHDTLGTVTHKNVVAVDRLDQRSLRHTVPLLNFQEAGKEKHGNDRITLQDPFFSQTTTTYFLFPNVAISIFKRFFIFLSVLPIANIDSNQASIQSRVRAWGVAHGITEDGAGRDNSHEMAVQRRDFQSVIAGIEQDWECAELIQQGLDADTLIHHGRFEGNNIAFLRDVGEMAELLSKAKGRN